MKWRSQKGAAIVEFAVILPLFIVLVFGIIEFGFIMFDKAVLTNACREGARAGIVYRFNPDTEEYDPLDLTEITSIVNSYLGNYLVTFGGSTTATTTATWGTNPTTVDDQLTVHVTYTYTYITLPGFIPILGSGLNMSAEAVMRMESED